MSEEEVFSDSSHVAFIDEPKNGQHWLYKVKKFFISKKSISNLSHTNSVLDRSSSSIGQHRGEERICKELRYFFMNPCQKYKAKKRKPFKLAIQIFKIALVTMQLVIFGEKNQEMVDFMNGSTEVFSSLLLNDTTTLYTKSEIYSQLNHIREQYFLFESSSVGNFGYARIEPDECAHNKNPILSSSEETKHNHSLPMCINEYTMFKADLDHDQLVYDTSKPKKVCYCLRPWFAAEKQRDDAVPLVNGSLYKINFHRLIELDLYMGIRTVRLLSSGSYHLADCYNITITAKFDNTARTGKISHSMDVKFNLTNCPYTNGTKPDGIETRPIAILLMILDMVIILVCSASLLLCLRSLWRGYRLRKSFERFYWKRYQKKLEWFVKFEFFNGWYFLIIISDVLTILGSIIKFTIELEWRGVINYDLCSLFLGIGCLCVWVGVLRYAGFFHQYNILVLTMKKSMPHVLRFMVCASVLYLGFLFCGWVVLGPYHHKFRNPIVTSEALFSLINGDDMYMTYEEMSKKSSLAWGFSQVYLYIFISLFIYIVLSLFIAVIMETYETIKEWQQSNFPPQNEIQKFLAEHSNSNEITQYDYNSDTYCCFCLYQNNDPDIDYNSSSDDDDLVDV